MTLLMLLACGDKDGSADATDDSSVEADADTDADTDSDTDTDVPRSDASGDIDLRDGTIGGDAVIEKAFSYSTGEAIFVYASSSPEASCELLTELFDPENKDAVDRGPLFLDGHCNLSFSMVGGMEVESYDLQSDIGGVVQANCAYGEGDWEYQSGADEGYYWSGEYYEASAWKGTFNILWYDTSAQAMQLEVDLKEWEGKFPYSSERTDEYKASGDIDGMIYTEHCDGLKNVGLF